MNKEANEKPIGLRVAPEVYESAKVLADKESWSLSRLARIALLFYLGARKALPR